MFPDALVCLVMAVFGMNVVQRVHHVTQEDHRHLWRILYERTGLLLDVAILALQAISMLNTACVLTPYVALTLVLATLVPAILVAACMAFQGLTQPSTCQSCVSVAALAVLMAVRKEPTTGLAPSCALVSLLGTYLCSSKHTLGPCRCACFHWIRCGASESTRRC